MTQLQEVSAVLDVLYEAKINLLLSICRVQVSMDDQPEGTDCLLGAAPETTPWASVTPYQIKFRSFSLELAAVMEGFARSSNCFIIKTIQITQDMAVQPINIASAQPGGGAPAYVPIAPYVPPGGEPGFRGRPPPRSRPPPSPSATPGAPGLALNGTPTTILSEYPLLVTMSIDVVKLKTPAK